MTKENFKTLLIVTLTVSIFFLILSFAIFSINGSKITKEGEIIQTGSLKLAINPEDVEKNIYIDGSLVNPRKNTITGLTGPTHTLRIETRNYNTWEGEISITPGYVNTKIIKLFPFNSSIDKLTETNIDSIFYSKEHDYAYYIVTDEGLTNNKRGIWELRLTSSGILFQSENKPRRVSTLTSPIKEILKSDYIIKPSPNNRYLLLSDSEYNNTLLLDSGQDQSPPPPINLGKILGFEPIKIDWFNNGNSLVIEGPSLLYEYNLETDKKSIINYNNSQDTLFSHNNTALYFANPLDDHKLWVYSDEVSRATDISLLSDLSEILVQNTTILYSSKNTLYLNNTLEPIEQTIGKGYSVETINSKGDSAILEKDDQYYLLSLKKRPGSKEIEPKIDKLSGYNNLDFAYNTNLLFDFNQESDIIYVLEPNGKNTVKINPNIEVVKDSFVFGQDGEKIYTLSREVLSEDKIATNLYSISVE